MQIDLPNFLLAASVTQAVVLSIFFLLPSNIGQTSNRLLVVVLLSIAAGFAEFFLYGTGVSRRHPDFAYAGTLLSVLQPPAIYLYTQSLMYRGFEIRWRHALHLLPLIAAAGVFFFGYALQPETEKLRILAEQDLPGMPTSLPLALVIHGVFLAYLVRSVVALRKFATQVKELFSDIESKQMAWLKLLLSGYAVVWAVSLAYCLAFYIFKNAAETEHVLMVAGVSGFLFINILILHALRQSALFSGLTAEETELLTSGQAIDDTPMPAAEQKAQIERYMVQEQPFLNANLSINQLARQLGMSPRDLSFVINRGFGCNFFDFVGEFRLRHARQLLEQSSGSMTVLEVMLASGYNSKSVFNTAFKQKTGLTPTQYRKKHIAIDGPTSTRPDAMRHQTPKSEE